MLKRLPHQIKSPSYMQSSLHFFFMLLTTTSSPIFEQLLTNMSPPLAVSSVKAVTMSHLLPILTDKWQVLNKYLLSVPPT